jgi:hypothetical protein
MDDGESYGGERQGLRCQQTAPLDYANYHQIGK